MLFGKLRPYLAKAAAPGFDGVCSSEFLVLSPGPEIHGRFLLYSLLSPGFVNWITSFTYGTKMPRVHPEQIGIADFPFPPLDQQLAIVKRLDEKLALLERRVSIARSLIPCWLSNGDRRSPALSPIHWFEVAPGDDGTHIRTVV